MPYITQERRLFVDPLVISDCERAKSAGELNYQLTRICQDYMDDKIKSYQYYNDVIGALECCKLEMYRRAIAPYEDTKITENGDVYL